jgi:hypothetical protein
MSYKGARVQRTGKIKNVAVHSDKIKRSSLHLSSLFDTLSQS